MSEALPTAGEGEQGGPGSAKPYGISPYRREGVLIGWKVNVRRRGREITRYFRTAAHGSLDEAYRAALAFREQVNREHPPLTKREFCATLRTNNSSGVPGVFRASDRTGEYWKAGVYFDGRTKTRQFSVRKYGEDEAYRLAVEARRQLLALVRGTAAHHPEVRHEAAAVADDLDEVIRQPANAAPPPNPYAHAPACEVPGVQLTHVKTALKNGAVAITPYWTAVIKKADGRPKRRYFSVLVHGDEEARRMAIAQRRAWEREAADMDGEARG